MPSRSAFVLVSVVFVGCASTDSSSGPPALPAAAAEAKPVHFVEGRFEEALATAKKENKLLFVDAWAPWCHTCLSMRDVVLSRPELGRYAKDFVFVAVDTDRPESAGFLERYRLKVWPTFFVVDPSTRAVLGMYGGSMSLDELTTMLDASLAGRRGAEVPGAKELAQGHAAYAEKRLADAARAYEEAATRLPDNLRANALVAAIRSLWEGAAYDRCVEFGREHAAAVTGSSAPSDFVLYLKECASKLSSETEKAAALDFVKTRLRALIDAPPAGASVDDRADTMAVLAELLLEQKDEAGARALEEGRLKLLEDAAKTARTPEAAQTYDYARMNAYLALGRGDEAVKMLEERTKQLPESYEAFARLGSTFVELKRWPQALAALDRAIALSYGPRRLRYIASKAKAQQASGDRTGAVATLEEEVKGWAALPATQKDDKKHEDARSRLEAARQPAAAAK